MSTYKLQEESVLTVNEIDQKLFEILSKQSDVFAYGAHPAIFNDLIFDFGATYKVKQFEYIHRIPGQKHNVSMETEIEDGIERFTKQILEHDFGQSKPILLGAIYVNLQIVDLSVPIKFLATFLVKQ